MQKRSNVMYARVGCIAGIYTPQTHHAGVMHHPTGAVKPAS
jgi:hypothetical protein